MYKITYETVYKLISFKNFTIVWPVTYLFRRSDSFFLAKQLNGESNIRYSKMTKSGLWATEIELFATEHLLKTDVYIYGQSGKTFFWLKFSAKFIDPTVVSSDEAIYLNHTNGNHYDIEKSTSTVNRNEKGLNKERWIMYTITYQTELQQM